MRFLYKHRFSSHEIKDSAVHKASSDGIVDFFKKHNSKINSVICFVPTNVPNPSYHCDCDQLNIFTWRNANFVYDNAFELESLSNISSIRRGLEYDQSLLKCCSLNRMDIVEQFDLTILRLTFSPLDDLFSYGIFSEKLEKIVSENQEFVRKYNSNCTIYIRILLNRENTSEYLDAEDKYNALLAKYIDAWNLENQGDE